MNPDALADLLSQLRAGLDDLYGERLARVILYGSQARGDAHDESDVDVAIVLHGPVDPFEEIDRMSDLAFRLMCTYGPHVSTYPLPIGAMNQSDKPIISSLLSEGVPV
jgi:predicted nucleotidyltransferase